MSTRSTGMTMRYAAGALLMAGGMACVVWGFAAFTGSALDGSGGSGVGRSMALFAGGGLATVVGFGLVAFTRAGQLRGAGGYTRMTIEQGYGVPAPIGGPGSHCRSCGAAVRADDQYCCSCGTSLVGTGSGAGPR